MNTHPQSIQFIIEEFAAQRKYRQQRRTEYLRRFQNIRHNLSFTDPKENIPCNTHPSVPAFEHPIADTTSRSKQQHANTYAPLIPSRSQGNGGGEGESLQEENVTLVRTLRELEMKSGEQIGNFKKSIETAKMQYVTQIQSLVDRSKRSKEENQSKMKKLKEQTEKAIEKNQEIEAVNKAIKSEMGNQPDQEPPEEVLDQIRKQYDEKIASFKAVFESSNEKIEALEKDFNEEEFIESTVTNEELLKSIEANASKAEEAAKILEDYRSLSEGKKEILAELASSMEMKEKEIAKMMELQQKMKTIMEKLTAEKQQYMQENSSMASQLMEIKELLLGSLGQSAE